MNDVKYHIVPIGEDVEGFIYVSNKKVTHIFKDLENCGIKWFVTGGDTNIVDPKYFEEYKRSQLMLSSMD